MGGVAMYNKVAPERGCSPTGRCGALTRDAAQVSAGMSQQDVCYNSRVEYICFWDESFHLVGWGAPRWKVSHQVSVYNRR